MSKELKVAKETILEAGKLILKDFNSNIKQQKKGNDDIFTISDKKSENLIIKRLTKKFPQYGIISEESKPIIKEINWVIDPIDGTFNFSRGIPFFGINLALINKKEPLLGISYDPLHKELFWGEKNKNAFYNNKIMEVSKVNNLNLAIIDSSTEFINQFPNSKTVRRFGCTALGLPYLARGNIDAKVFNSSHYIWDWVAGFLMIEEAGGKITDLEGNKWSFNSKNFIASNGILHSKLLNLLRSKPKTI